MRSRMDITCPQCSFTRTVQEDKIPDTADVAVCPQCNYRFFFRGLESFGPPKNGKTEPEGQHPLDSSAPPRAPWHEPHSHGHPGSPPYRPPHPNWARPLAPPTDTEIPWERLDHYGFFQALSLTIKRVLKSHTTFFENMELGTGYRRAFAFYLLLGVFAFLVNGLWMTTLPGFLPPASEAGVSPLAIKGMMLFGLLMLAPPVVALKFYLSTALINLFLSFFQANGKGFEGTARVVAYSSATSILVVVPFLGAAFASLWSLLLVVIGCKIVHKAPMAHVLYALLPLFMLMFMIALWLQGPLLF